MKKSLQKTFLTLFALVGLTSTQLIAQSSWTFDTDLEGFENGAVVQTAHGSEESRGVLIATPAGNMKFPRIDHNDVTIDADVVKNFKIVVKNTSDAEQIRLRVNTSTGNFFYTLADITANDTEFKTYTASDISSLEFSGDGSSNTWSGAVTILNIQFKKLDNTSVGTNPIYIDEITFTSESLSIEKIVKDDSSISVYPNPAKDKLTISAPSKVSKIEVFNLLGQKVLSNEGKNALNLSSLGKGAYLIKIFQENNVISTKRFIKN